MLRTRSGERLDGWLEQVQRSKLPELQSFATGIEKDKDAVRAGLTWWINNGMVEGQVTKLKLIKRQGYGKAGFPLLRKRLCSASGSFMRCKEEEHSYHCRYSKSGLL